MELHVADPKPYLRSLLVFFTSNSKESRQQSSLVVEEVELDTNIPYRANPTHAS